jgi:hypothetical protein
MCLNIFFLKYYKGDTSNILPPKWPAPFGYSGEWPQRQTPPPPGIQPKEILKCKEKGVVKIMKSVNGYE